MKFRNVSKRVKMFKKKEDWVSIQPNEVVELDVEANLSESGLERVIKGPEQKIKPKVKKDKPKLKKAEKPKDKPQIKEEELKKMTKDQLNDFAAVNGFKKLSTRSKHSKMVQEIIKFFKNEK